MSFFTSTPQWHLVSAEPELLEWQLNHMCLLEVAGKKITLARFEDQYFAFAHKCPHASGVMADGFIDATGQVVCPLHRYRFNIKNGRNTSGEGYYLKTYPLERREDGLYVAF